MLKAKALRNHGSKEDAISRTVEKMQETDFADYIVASMYAKLDRVLTELAAKYGKTCRILQNTDGGQGREKSMFHLMFEFDGNLYGVIKKNLKKEDEWGKVKKIGTRYQMNPRRILLVNTRISSDFADFLEGFSDYYITNLTEESFRKKVTRMIEADFQEAA